MMELGEDLEGASSRLAEGLKSCRSVLLNYRAMLGTEELNGLERVIDRPPRPGDQLDAD